MLGTVASAAGAGWAALLVGYFVSSSVLSRVGARRKGERTERTVAKGGPRDAAQVLANGGVFGLAACAACVVPGSWPMAVAAGALAASAADTWATEIGTWLGGTPRHVISWQPLEPGMSGGVTVAGTVAMAIGALAVAGLAVLCGWPRDMVGAIAGGGIVGAIADSWLGATVQERRQCPQCHTATEREVHSCGTPAPVVAGLRFVSNDVVNAIATMGGAATTLLWSSAA